MPSPNRTCEAIGRHLDSVIAHYSLPEVDLGDDVRRVDHTDRVADLSSRRSAGLTGDDDLQVKRGVVNVRDNVRRRTIVLRAGHKYLARP